MKGLVKGKSSHVRIFKKRIETRKQRRKKERRLKKAAFTDKYIKLSQQRKCYFNNSFDARGPGKYVRIFKRNPINHESKKDSSNGESDSSMVESEEDEVPKETEKEEVNNLDSIVRESKREKSKLKKVLGKMHDTRRLALIAANEDEDKEIKMLEKQLHMDKRKSKGLPSAFVSCGLDYILDVLNPEKLNSSVAAENNLLAASEGFDKDFAVISDKKKIIRSTKDEVVSNNEDSESDFSEDSYKLDLEDSEEDIDDADSDSSDAGEDFGRDVDEELKKNEETLDFDGASDGEDKLRDKVSPERGNSNSVNNEKDVESKPSRGVWEDIYGRKRDRKGNIIPESKRYVPPQMRENVGGDAKKKEELERLRRHLKGLINRLAEANLHSISTQVELIYQDHSRRVVNEVLTGLLSEALGMPSSVPERRVMEHAVLVAALQANVGSEVGAHILQSFVKKFSDMLNQDNSDVSDKTLDNILTFICHLYTFKVCGSTLILELANKVLDRFGEKEVELLLVALRAVGFSLRKDNPSALKDLVLRIHSNAADAVASANLQSRVKFLLEILLTIKNNNISKLPQYDPLMAEQLRKLLKSIIRPGNITTPLIISLDDLLQADERGRWWLVGSAWNGQGPKGVTAPKSAEHGTGTKMSHQVAELARKLRISTDSRRAIFSTLMMAEDCNEAFEKLMRLHGAVGRDVAAVLVHCVQSESAYNPFYAVVADKLVNANRQHRMALQCTLWDKFKNTDAMRSHQMTNLAKFMAHLYLNGSLPLSVLKTVQFVDMNGSLVRLLRRCLLSVLLHKDDKAVSAVWTRVSAGKQLGQFRESIRLFLQHFMLKASNEMTDNSGQSALLRDRIEIADSILQGQ